MNLAPAVPPAVRQALANAFTETLGHLSGGGLRLALEFPAEIDARQKAWPKGATLCEGKIDPPDETLARLTLHLRADPRVAGHVRELDRLTREAGAELPYEGLQAHSFLDQLLAEDGWQHPAEVLDGDLLEMYYPMLIRLAGLRAEHAEDPAPLLVLRQRLEVGQTELEAGEELLDAIVERLLALEPELAERVLICIAGRYRLLREDSGRQSEESWRSASLP